MQNSDRWTEEMNKLSAIVSKFPLQKTIKWGAEVFTYNGRNVLSYGGFKNYFTIWFYNGVFFTDPYKVLMNAQEGKTKSLRQWRFLSFKDMDENKIAAYIKEAISIEDKGLKLAPEKFKPIPVSEIMHIYFDADKKLKTCFEQLSPGKQKEYILYINEAKQEQTKQKRLEKIKPLILSGKGLNDHYKK